MKKTILGILIVTFIFFGNTNTTSALSKKTVTTSGTVVSNTNTKIQCGKRISGNYVICDINNDNMINADDAELVLKYAVNLIVFTKQELLLADANGDGKVNTGDAVAILRYAEGMIGNPNNGTNVCEKVYYYGCRVGDINCDKKINEEDAKLVLKNSVNLISFNSKQLLLAEVNGDKKVNTGDATTILRFVDGQFEYFPVECKSVITTPINDPTDDPIDTPINNPSTPIDDQVTNPQTSDIPVVLLIVICVTSLAIAIYEILKLKNIKE